MSIVAPAWIKWTHLGLVIFGITSYLTAELAEHSDGLGYYVHAYLGLTLLLFITSRFFYGIWGQPKYRFSQWFPCKISYVKTIYEDAQCLLKLKLPERDDHKGIAGLVQAFGLIVFSWMAITGTIMFVLGDENSFVVEMHEVGETLIPIFLVLHIGAVILHIISGQKILSKIFPFASRSNKQQELKI